MLDISVLITCYNKEEYLDECVKSIFRQTEKPREIIVVHDGCKNVGVHLDVDNVVLKENLGVAKARDKAVKLSSSTLLLFVDADDVLSPDYLEKMVRVMMKGGDIVYPDLFLWVPGGGRLVITPNKITPAFVRDFKKVVMPVTSLMSRKMYDDLGGFREWPVLEDLDFFIRAMCNGYTFKKAQTLLWYRRPPGTRNSIDLAKRKQVLDQILAQFEFVGNSIKYAQNKL